MPVDKISLPTDPRVSLRSAYLNGLTYGYLYSQPPPGTSRRGTIILIHGFPDISAGWRYQIPLLTSLGLTVIAPDCPGYGRTDSPRYNISYYTYKRVADDLAQLCRQLGLSQIILGGHDWGGAIVYRFAQYYPDLVSHVVAICTPYFPPNATYEPLHLSVQTRLPNFRYQEHFASGEFEDHFQSRSQIRGFLNAMYGGKGPNGEQAFNPEAGVDFALIPHLQPSTLITSTELDYYAQEFSRHGLNGPLNWYRNREENWKDEWEAWFGGGKYVDGSHVPKIEQEVLFVLATKDSALKPAMAAKMAERVPKLTRREAVAGHWALWEKSQELNDILSEWLRENVFKDGIDSKL